MTIPVSNSIHRVLIVDDEKENRSSLERAMRDDNPNWEVFTADGAKTAIDLVRVQADRKQPIDVVITDLVMESEQDGMAVLSDVRKIDPLIMAILVTAKEKNLDRYKAFEIGAFDVIEKNIRGASAAREILFKTRAAIQYRSWSRNIEFVRRYFDPGVFDKIKDSPEALALKERTITICFWDIRGFSLLCEQLKAHPTLISGFLKEYCDLAAQTIFEHHGLLDKFIGDGVMALFGVLNGDDGSVANDASHAAAAAVAFRPRFDDLVKRWMGKWKLYCATSIDIGLGCGIHTGAALVGNVGTEFRDQFTALGPQVNLAARIESKSKSGQILVSQTTAAYLTGTVRTVYSADISDIKNIPGTFKLFEVP